LWRNFSTEETRRLLKKYSGSRCGATASDPRRSDDAIALATVRISNNGDEAVPPQPLDV